MATLAPVVSSSGSGNRARGLWPASSQASSLGRSTVIDAIEEMLAPTCADSFDSCAPPRHYHAVQEEHFEIIEGALRWQVGASSGVASVGDRLVVPAGAAHTFCRTDETAATPTTRDVPTRVRSWLVPPGPGGREYFEELAGLTRDAAPETEWDVLVCSNAIRLSSWSYPELWCSLVLAAAAFTGHAPHHPGFYATPDDPLHSGGTDQI